MERYDNYIGGEWVGGDYRPNISPSDVDEIRGILAP